MMPVRPRESEASALDTPTESGVPLLATGLIAELVVRTSYASQGKRAYSVASRAGFEDS